MPDAPAASLDVDLDLAAIEARAVEIARAAGARALAAYRDAWLQLEFKGSKQDDPVTAADRDIETFLREALRADFPDHGLVGEEHADDVAADADFVWALDPLDGTANFASHLPLWGVSMGLMHRGEPVVGCVWVPVGPDLSPGVFHARRGGGAFFDGTPIAIAEGEDQRGRLIALPGRSWRLFRFKRSPGGTPRQQRGLADPRSLGSIAAELVLVASGALRLAVFVQPKIWDVLAGVLIVQEAGGSARVWRNRAWHELDRFEVVPPQKGDAPPSYRHWSRPIVVGTPTVAERTVGALVWQPRLPQRLLKALGLA